MKITSVQNRLIKDHLRLKEKPGKYNNGLLIEGVRLINSAISANSSFRKCFYTETFLKSAGGGRLIDRIKVLLPDPAHYCFEVSASVMKKLSDTETPQGIIVELEYVKPTLNSINFRSAPLVVVCDGIQDPGNLGSIIRISDAAGADAVLVTEGSCNPLSAKCVRATAGSLFNLPVLVENTTDIVTFLKSGKIPLYLADAHSNHIVYKEDFTGPVAFIFGSEASGAGKILENKADFRITIPMRGKTESLNVGMSAGICLYEVLRQRMAPLTRPLR
ncbi:MAG: RNA methyltransferase [Nitrospirae bacterium]|nr:MAG: RNA methyltransferase [Nitrospirota bacterium]